MNATESTPAVKPARKPRKPRAKPERKIRVLEQPTADTDGWGAVAITVGKQTDTYLVRFVESDFGFGAVGFEVEKLDADLATVESYHVHLSDRPEECSCTCKGCTHHGHCKHRDGLRKLVEEGRLPRLWTARDHRHHPDGPQGQEPPQLDEVAYFDPAQLDDRA